ncbi:alpha-amylase family glycosyl hydrolase [Actinoplanes sp. TRM 88003]|uniref:Alpha-amylase n=1 Tax=Paractinoplanes aksuensis TaxID=2939490 RepID=A0ABT1DME1_9ACTN|nr:alpha-amylase family glycosyl hydrolase [Actinoplanes aksuensis]MCO8271678.1 alpha-amylase family glycosyl hydrolase [Actinoplanes aksuensis]
MRIRRRLAVLLSAVLAGGVISAPAAASGGSSLPGRHSLRAPVTDENFYFVMADRFDNGSTANDQGGLGADPLVSGFDPTRKGFYNGGDLAGLLRRIDYIKGLGTTSIWLTPSFKNKAVQLEDGPSAGYHGYWITDFTQIDPHLGTNAELKALIDAAHQKGMKVYFDIITNHTADVIGYESGARQPYVSKDVAPYKTAQGRPFDDRDHAGKATFPRLDPATSFPYTPVLDPAERNVKVPAWLNDTTLYHNRGDTTFVGENSLYGDFFGLDDLFTEHPRVVNGMIDVYEKWIADFGIDGFRIDTMKHVNDEFWQKFGPEVLSFARKHGKPEFFMFGEVFDTSKSFTSQFTTKDRMQAVLDFPFQDAARNYASRGQSAAALEQFFAGDDWYTDADSNVYQLPTFLGNHDMGRIGSFVQADNPGAGDATWLARDRLAHELMYFSRGNPVIYYGDEQGFTGPGGDQDARQTLFASRVPEYLDDDLIGTAATHAQDNFVTTHPLYAGIAGLAALTKRHPTLRDGAHQHRYAATGTGVYAFSRADQREYVVALNNSTSPQTAAVPTYLAQGKFERVYGSGPATATSAADRRLTLTVPALSTVVYASTGRIPASKAAPAVTLAAPAPSAESRARMQVSASLGGSSFAEVTFYARTGRGAWTPIGTDDNAPYRVFHDVSGLRAGTTVEYKAVVLDNAGHSRTSSSRAAKVPPPALTIEAPAEGANVRGEVEVRAVADPDRASHVVRFERSVAGGAWTTIGRDSSSPAYTVFDDLSPLNLAAGTQIRYRAVLSDPTVVSAVRTVRYAGPPQTVATVHYFRPAGDYADWGLHLWGEAVDPTVLAEIAWDKPWPASSVDAGWATYEIPLVDDTEPVNFIMHRPNGDAVPTTREPGGDRAFTPIDNPQIWLKQGDPAVYTTAPPTS